MIAVTEMVLKLSDAWILLAPDLSESCGDREIGVAVGEGRTVGKGVVDMWLVLYGCNEEVVAGEMGGTGVILSLGAGPASGIVHMETGSIDAESTFHDPFVAVDAPGDATVEPAGVEHDSAGTAFDSPGVDAAVGSVGAHAALKAAFGYAVCLSGVDAAVGSAGTVVDAQVGSAGTGVGNEVGSAGIGVAAGFAGIGVGVAVDSAGNGVDAAVDFAGGSAGIGVDAAGGSAGICVGAAVDFAGCSAGIGVDAVGGSAGIGVVGGSVVVVSVAHLMSEPIAWPASLLIGLSHPSVLLHPQTSQAETHCLCSPGAFGGIPVADGLCSLAVPGCLGRILEHCLQPCYWHRKGLHFDSRRRPG